MKHFAQLTKIEYALKDGTKTVFVETSRSVELIDETTYRNIVDSSPFFRRLGGSEVHQKEYTCRGYITTKITSKDPSRTQKVERLFNFNVEGA